MSIKESGATALVRFRGLGLVVFNKAKNRGEVAIIRDEKHELSIKVQAPRFVDGSDKDLLQYVDVAVYKDLPKKGIAIEIAANGNSAVNGYEIYHSSGEFNRIDCDDANDYRWIVDMSDLHGDDLARADGATRFPISKLYIENGMFYAHNLDTEMVFKKIEKAADGNEVSSGVFGNIAETIGVKLESDEVDIRVKVGEETTSHALSRVDGLPFRIVIDNMNYETDAAVSDMPDYYKYQGSASGRTFDLEPIKDVAAGGAITSGAFCHPIDGGDICINSIDELDD